MNNNFNWIGEENDEPKQTFENTPFQLADNTTDLFDLFLDEDIQYARRQINIQIQNSNMTPTAKAASRLMNTLNAITKQAQRNQQRRDVMHR